MRSLFSHGGFVVLPMLVLLAACGTELGAPNAEDEQINLDVATYAADATVDDIDLMTTESERMMLPTFRTNDGCTRTGLFRIRCPQRHFGDNINFTREVTYLGLTGNEQEFFDPDTTEAISVLAAFEGTRTGEDVEITVNRQRDMTVSNLFGDETERIWNGTGNSDVGRTRHSDEKGDRVYDISSSSTVESVKIAVPRHGTWPISGTITRHVTVEVVGGLEDDRTRSRTVVIEFNGTQFATITINGETFTFDLETRTVVRDEKA